MATLHALMEVGDWKGSALRAGLSDSSATRHAPLFGRLVRRLVEIGLPESTPAAAFFVPGRIEVLGKHTDYAGGESLVCAVERGFCLVAASHPSEQFVFEDAAWRESREVGAGEAKGWGRYPAAVYRRCRSHFGPFEGGIHAVFASTLPPDAGLSSSSALLTAAFLAIDALFGVSSNPHFHEAVGSQLACADFLGHVENGRTFGSLPGECGVGTAGGSQDHTAILCSAADAISRFRYRPSETHQVISLPNDVTFVVALSGVSARKSDTHREAYNAASLSAEEVVARWNVGRREPAVHLRAAMCSADGGPAAMEALLADAPALLRRYRHFFAESEEIVPAAAVALERADWEGFGHIADRSQALAETWLGNQVAETSALARLARANGARAASAFGAGFGGAVWALVETEAAESFGRRWLAAYRLDFPNREASCFETRPGPPATPLLP